MVTTRCSRPSTLSRSRSRPTAAPSAPPTSIQSEPALFEQIVEEVDPDQLEQFGEQHRRAARLMSDEGPGGAPEHDIGPGMGVDRRRRAAGARPRRAWSGRAARRWRPRARRRRSARPSSPRCARPGCRSNRRSAADAPAPAAAARRPATSVQRTRSSVKAKEARPAAMATKVARLSRTTSSVTAQS